MDLMKTVEEVSIKHIYRCFNFKVDFLSKWGLGSPLGTLFFEEFMNSARVAEGSFTVF